jgi:hypothetical protein
MAEGIAWLPIPKADPSSLASLSIVGLRPRADLNNTMGKIVSCFMPKRFGVEVKEVEGGTEVVSLKSINLHIDFDPGEARHDHSTW